MTSSLDNKDVEELGMLDEKDMRPMEFARLDEMVETTQSAVVKQSTKIFNYLSGPLIAYGVVVGLYFAYAPGQWAWFSWHPLAMIFSFITLAGNAALIKKIGGYDNTKTHAYLMSTAVILASFGFYVIYTNKIMLGKPHFMTIHGKLGAFIIIGYYAVGILGAVALHPDFGMMRDSKTIRFIHRWLARIFTGLAWFCCVLGMMTLLKDDQWKLPIFYLPLIAGGYFILL